MMDAHFRVTMRSITQLLEARGLGTGGKVQKYIDSEVLRLSEPYLPFQTGGLIKSGIAGTVVGSGEVCYNAPQARYLYYGHVMVGRAPKRVTNKPLTYHGAPKRGAKWFERMKVDHVKTILHGAARISGGKVE